MLAMEQYLHNVHHFIVNPQLLCVIGKSDEVFVCIVCVGVHCFTKHFVIYLATMLEHIADGALTVVNGKCNVVFGDSCLAEVVNIIFNVIDLYRHGCIKSAGCTPGYGDGPNPRHKIAVAISEQRRFHADNCFGNGGSDYLLIGEDQFVCKLIIALTDTLKKAV